MVEPPKKRRRGQTTSLSLGDLQTALDSAISSQGNTELAFLYLIDRYDFDLNEMTIRLQGLHSSRLAVVQRETDHPYILARERFGYQFF